MNVVYFPQANLIFMKENSRFVIVSCSVKAWCLVMPAIFGYK